MQTPPLKSEPTKILVVPLPYLVKKEDLEAAIQLCREALDVLISPNDEAIIRVVNQTIVQLNHLLQENQYNRAVDAYFYYPNTEIMIARASAIFQLAQRCAVWEPLRTRIHIEHPDEELRRQTPGTFENLFHLS